MDGNQHSNINSEFVSNVITVFHLGRRVPPYWNIISILIWKSMKEWACLFVSRICSVFHVLYIVRDNNPVLSERKYYAGEKINFEKNECYQIIGIFL